MSTIEYDFCTCTRKTANKNIVYHVSSVLIGRFWGTSTKLLHESFMTLRPGFRESIEDGQHSI